mmetsp:Transcript_5381/g.9034  ORF Transcript_5381/g.9034 Transcript_5381/m.9034 type:complete len:476 (-) Transcript_5381:1391-2818(-)
MDSPVMKGEVQKFLIRDDARVATLIDDAILMVRREDFIFADHYTVKAAFEEPKGKWSNIVKDSVFMEAKDFHLRYSDKVMGRVLEVMKREMVQQKDNSKVTEENYATVKQLIGVLHDVIKDTRFEDYAFSAIIKGSQSQKQYFGDPGWAYRSSQQLFKRSLGLRHKMENKYELSTPISSFIEGADEGIQTITNFMLITLLITFFLAYIVTNQLVRNQIKEKTFENAMLRCLGWQKSHIVFLVAQKALLFYVLPGVTLGVLLTYCLVLQCREMALEMANIEVPILFDGVVIVTAVLLSLVLPLISMVEPIFEETQMELRDALDVFSPKLNVIKVTLTQLYSKYGLSVDQLVLGVTLSVFGIVTYTVVPILFIIGDQGTAHLLLLILLFTRIIGVIMIAQLAITPLSKLFIKAYAHFSALVLRSKEVRRLQPIVMKNMGAHRARNTKFGMLFITTVFFCIFVMSFGLQIEELMLSSI